jgi:hypothetical protein
MNSNKEEIPSTTDQWEDRLVPVLHRIARRADEISNQEGRVHGGDLECWLQAEREILDLQDSLLEPDDAKSGLVRL